MRYRATVLFVLALAVAGCRQAEGTIPEPRGEQVNKTVDISRDLQGVASGGRGAVDDLRADLGSLSGQPPPGHLVGELSARLDDALAGTTLTDAAAMRLADRLFVATTARDLSVRQQAALRTEVTGALTSAGVPQPKAEPVAAVVGEIQSVIGENRKRWWHWR